MFPLVDPGHRKRSKSGTSAFPQPWITRPRFLGLINKTTLRQTKEKEEMRGKYKVTVRLAETSNIHYHYYFRALSLSAYDFVADVQDHGDAP